MFIVKGLSFKRQDGFLFKNLSFTLELCQLAIISGDNGTGKSTLLRILLGLVPLMHGSILWDGEHLHKIAPLFYAQVSYLGHKLGLKAALTPVENLKTTLALAHCGLESDILPALERVGLEKSANIPVECLSAGQKQRLALARLILKPTRCWFLDEPLTTLDNKGIVLLENLLLTHLRQGGMALVATHQALNLSNYPHHIIQLGSR